MAKAEVTSSEMNRPAISHADMDRKLDEHFRFEAQDDVEGGSLGVKSCNHAIVYQRLAEAVGVTTHR